MDYRSPFEIRRQFLEEARAAQLSSPKPRQKAAGGLASSSNSGVTSSATTVSGGSQFACSSSGSAAGSSSLLSTALPDDPTALVREAPGAENIKALNESLEHDEAVQRYMESRSLSVEDAAKYIMANGSTAQRLSFFGQIRETLVDMNQKRISSVLSILLDSMWAQDPELQCLVPNELLKCLGLVSSSTAVELLEVTTTMLTVKTAAIREEWGKLLLGLVACLSVEQIEGDVVPLAIKKSEHAEAQDQRELSCGLLGCVCEYIPRDHTERLVLPRALALCQDTNIGVRQHMCQQLGSIARALGIETAKTRIAPELFELLNDEERSVSRTAFSCLIDLVEFFGPEYRKERLYPIIKNYISNPPSEVVSLLIGEFGRFLDEIKGDISTNEDVVLFANFYQTAIQKVDDDSRKHCAFNLPAVAVSLPLVVFPTHLSPCLNKLAGDSCVAVRRSIAAGFHELVPILGESAATHLENPFLTLIRDKDSGVRALLFSHINVLLDCFVSQMRKAARAAFFHTLGEIMQNIATDHDKNWRGMGYFIQVVASYQVHFEEAIIIDNFIPRLIQYVKNGATLLKDDCARLVVRLVYQVTNINAKVQILSKLNNDFARGGSCYLRQSYLRFAREMCVLFSLRCIRERLFECCLELQRDSVGLVRLALAKSLPHLSRGLRRSSPGALEDEFNNMLQRLLMDDDELVRAAARDGKELIDKMEKERRGASKLLEQAEAEDQRREKAEQAMLDLAKEFDKAERRAKLRDLIKNEREKELIDIPAVSSNPKRTHGYPTTLKRSKEAPGSPLRGGLPRLSHGSKLASSAAGVPSASRKRF